MPDLGSAVAPIMELLAPVVGRALKSFFATTAGMIVLTGLVMIGCVVINRDAGGWAMLAAGGLALLVGAVAGWLLAVKRAVTGALAHALVKLGLGERAMRMIFERMLGVHAEMAHGERGHHVAQKAERLPLREAEQRLRGVVDSLVAERAAKQGVRAFFARKIRDSALRRVEQITLAEFRKEDASHGGVDLVKVREDLGARIDSLAGDAVGAAAKKVTLLAIGGVLLLSIGGAFAIREIFVRT